jgi:hypothetical protein
MISSTPTPWDICQSANSNLVHIETALDGSIIGGVQIATVNKGDIDTRMANALLITTAVNAHEELLELAAEALWRRDYPNGGSIYKTYDSLQFHDKQLYRNQALRRTA